METSTPTFDVRKYLLEHAASVFDTMLSLKIAAMPAGPLPSFPQRVIGCVGVGGDKVNGAVYLHLSADFARQATSGMLGLPVEEIAGDTDVNDVVGELTNMLAGGLKSALCDAGTECAVSTPAIIRGTDFEIEAPPDIRRELLLFNCGENRIAVEAHIKFN